MLWPMAVLGFLAAAGGLLGASVVGKPLLRDLESFFRLVPAFESAGPAEGLLTGLSVGIGLLGIGVGLGFYRLRREPALGALGRFLQRQWYIEDLYQILFVAPGKWLAGVLAGVVELELIDGAVNGVGEIVRRTGAAVRRLQTGYVRTYATAILVGTVLVVGYWLLRQ